jgi:hypothetical protein
MKDHQVIWDTTKQARLDRRILRARLERHEKDRALLAMAPVVTRPAASLADILGFNPFAR